MIVDRSELLTSDISRWGPTVTHNQSLVLHSFESSLLKSLFICCLAHFDITGAILKHENNRAQVKYEMLRAHSLDGDPITEVCQQFGFSREGFYRIQQGFTDLGFASLLPRKPGRKGPVYTVVLSGDFV